MSERENKLASSEETARQKMLLLESFLKDKNIRLIIIGTEKAKIYIWNNPLTTDGVRIDLLSPVICQTTDPFIYTECCYVRSLTALLYPNELSSSVIMTNVLRSREKDDVSQCLVYQNGIDFFEDGSSHISADMAPITTGTYSPFNLNMTPIKEGREYLRSLPTVGQMPKQIDFFSAIGKICDIGLQIAKDKQLTEERIAKLRQVVHLESIW